MTVDYLILCDDVAHSPSGNPVLVGVVDELAHPVPVRVSLLTAFARLRGAPGVVTDVDLVWIDPSGQEFWRRHRQLSVGPRGLSYWWVPMTDLVFTRPGRYRLVARVDRQEMASTELELTQLVPEPERVQ
jgi:hypothetical protein